MKKKYEKLIINEIYLDNKLLILMNSDWEPGDGGPPPWAGGPNKAQEKQDNNPFKNSSFDNNSFEK